MKTARERVFWGAVLVFLLCGVFTFFILNHEAIQISLESTPQAHITIIANASVPTLDVGLLTGVTPTSTIDPMISNGSGLSLGNYVQISGTEGSGVNVRSSPELSGKPAFIAQESEVYLLVGGPTSRDGYTWWQISTPYDQSRQGWAVDQYLHLIDPN